MKVRLYRPFDLGAFMTTLPRTVHQIAVLDRLAADLEPVGHRVENSRPLTSFG